MSWDEYDDVQVREYMNRVELPEFLKANMEDGDRWDGKNIFLLKHQIERLKWLL